MSDGILTILKLCLIALVYLFLLRVVWVVGAELRGTPTVVVGGPSPADARQRRKTWTVSIIEPASAAATWAVEGELTVGRAPGCSISVPDDSFASQVHARVFDREGDAWAEDLGSTNGTLLNGKALTEQKRLRKGDRLQVGSTLLEVRR